MQSSKTEGRFRYQDDLSSTGCWRVHDSTTIWQIVSVQELVKSRLRAKGKLMILIRAGRQSGLAEGKTRLMVVWVGPSIYFLLANYLGSALHN